MERSSTGPRWRRRSVRMALAMMLLAAAPAAAAGAAPAPKGTARTSVVPYEELNSPGRDFEITYSADGKRAVLASSREGGFGGNDIYTTECVDGRWTTPVNIGPAINTGVNEQEPSLSADGKLLYFTRYTSVLDGDLYVSRNVNGVWQQAENWNDVPELPALNSPTSEEHCPIIVSEDLIYFSHDVPGVTRQSDIWEVRREGGAWGQPRPLPGRINSAYRDHLNWTGISRAGDALIVVSDRPDRGSRGASDEWISFRNPRGEWSAPRNLGDRINTSAAEACWAFTPDGLKFAGASGRSGSQGVSDLYWVHKNDIPLLRNFEPAAQPPINLLAASES